MPNGYDPFAVTDDRTALAPRRESLPYRDVGMDLLSGESKEEATARRQFQQQQRLNMQQQRLTLRSQTAAGKKRAPIDPDSLVDQVLDSQDMSGALKQSRSRKSLLGASLARWKTELSNFDQEHADLFDLDKRGKPSPDVISGKTPPRKLTSMKAELSKEEAVAQEKTGFLAGLLPGRHHGDPTAEAAAATGKLPSERKKTSQTEAEYQDAVRKRKFLTDELERTKKAHEEEIKNYGELSDRALGITPEGVADARAKVNQQRAVAKQPPVEDYPDPTGSDWVSQKIREVNAYRRQKGQRLIDPKTMMLHLPKKGEAPVSEKMPEIKGITEQQFIDHVSDHSEIGRMSEYHSALNVLGNLKATGHTHVGTQKIDDMIARYGGEQEFNNAQLVQTYNRLRSRIAEIDRTLPGMTDKGKKPLQDERDILTQLKAEKDPLIKQQGLEGAINPPPFWRYTMLPQDEIERRKQAIATAGQPQPSFFTPKEMLAQTFETGLPLAAGVLAMKYGSPASVPIVTGAAAMAGRATGKLIRGEPDTPLETAAYGAMWAGGSMIPGGDIAVTPLAAMRQPIMAVAAKVIPKAVIGYGAGFSLDALYQASTRDKIDWAEARRTGGFMGALGLFGGAIDAYDIHGASTTMRASLIQHARKNFGFTGSTWEELRDWAKIEGMKRAGPEAPPPSAGELPAPAEPKPPGPKPAPAAEPTALDLLEPDLAKELQVAPEEPPTPTALKPLPEGTYTEYLGKKYPAAEGVGEPVDHWLIKMPGDTSDRGEGGLTAEALAARGYQAPAVPEDRPRPEGVPEGFIHVGGGMWKNPATPLAPPLYREREYQPPTGGPEDATERRIQPPDDLEKRRRDAEVRPPTGVEPGGGVQQRPEGVEEGAPRQAAPELPAEVAHPLQGTTFYRGTSPVKTGGGEAGDKFYSADRETAEEYAAAGALQGVAGKVEEVKGEALPKNLYQAEDKPELARKLSIPEGEAYQPGFDAKVKAILSKQGYEGIRYTAGSDLTGGQGQEEIHVFGKAETPLPWQQTAPAKKLAAQKKVLEKSMAAAKLRGDTDRFNELQAKWNQANVKLRGLEPTEERMATEPKAVELPEEEKKAAPIAKGAAPSGAPAVQAAVGPGQTPTLVPKAKGLKHISVGVPADGNPDILNAIEEIGGLKYPLKSDKGGEYDGFREAMGKGKAKFLVRHNRGFAPDLMLELLKEQGYNLNTPDEMYAAITKAVEGRQKMRRSWKQQQYEDKFNNAFLDDTRPPKLKRKGQPISVDDLATGDTFEVNGEPFKVTGLDEDGNVTIADGVETTVPEGTVVHPDSGTLEKAPRGKGEFVPEEPKLTLDSATVEQQATEAAAKRARDESAAAKEKLGTLAKKPLTGDSSNVGQGTLMAQDADLFSGKSQEDMAKAATVEDVWRNQYARQLEKMKAQDRAGSSGLSAASEALRTAEMLGLPKEQVARDLADTGMLKHNIDYALKSYRGPGERMQLDPKEHGFPSDEAFEKDFKDNATEKETRDDYLRRRFCKGKGGMNDYSALT